MAKFLQLSDLHLDSKIAELDAQKRAVRRQELKDSFCRAIELAKTEAVDFILICGDLFDSEYAEPGTLALLARELACNLPVFLSPGNHDPYTAAAVRDSQLPDNVHVFGGAIEAVELPDIHVRVYGRGFLDSEEPHPLLAGFRAADDAMANVMALHGEVTTGESSYNPVRPDDIANSGLDYLALGHVHTFSQLQKAGNTYYAYSGTHEGHGFDECGEKGVILGEVEKGRVSIKFVPTCIRQYQRIGVDITGCTLIEDVASRVRDAAATPEFLYQIELCGTRDTSLNLQMDLLQSMLSVDAFFLKLRDASKPGYLLEQIAKEPTLKGVFARHVLKEMEQNPQNAGLLQEAAGLVLDLF